MAMQQCPNGHLYDDTKNSSCPYCSGGNSINVTVPLSDGQPAAGGDMFPPTAQLDTPAPPPVNVQNYIPPQPQVANVQEDNFPATAPVDTPFEKTTYKEDVVVNTKGVIEVRGWLVCLEGEKRGADFRIHGERNTIGRGTENDIKLDFDSSISRGINAIITYDNRNNKFYIYQSNSKNNIYVNGQLLLVNAIELNDYDIIEIGSTKLIFRSLCNDQFVWENLKKEEKAE